MIILTFLRLLKQKIAATLESFRKQKHIIRNKYCWSPDIKYLLLASFCIAKKYPRGHFPLQRNTYFPDGILNVQYCPKLVLHLKWNNHFHLKFLAEKCDNQKTAFLASGNCNLLQWRIYPRAPTSFYIYYWWQSKFKTENWKGTRTIFLEEL